jgi:hypothetical protein
MESHVVTMIWRYLPVITTQLERIADALERLAQGRDGRERSRSELVEETYED